jgi:Glycosyl transferase family 2
VEALRTPTPLAAAELAEPLVSVVIPCLNEAESVGECVRHAKRALDGSGLSGEVVVVDNGSSDGSAAIAAEAGARVIREPRRGYGSAYAAGFGEARGRFIVMADADMSYDLADIPRFVEQLQDGADLVMGSRLNGRIHDGAMPWLHRRIGNPLLTGVLNLFFGTTISDAHCGMRAFRRDLLPRLDLQATGMELASEHLIRSAKLGLEVREIPIAYMPRIGRSKLSPLPDGWRHLRLLLVHSPTWLFIVPGGALLLLAMIAGALGLTGTAGLDDELPPLLVASLLAIVGSQLIQFGVFARSYAVWHLGERDQLFEGIRRRVSLETVLATGAAVALAGALVTTVMVIRWWDRGIDTPLERGLTVASLTLAVIGVQIVFGAFLLSVLGLRQRRADPEPHGPRATP